MESKLLDIFKTGNLLFVGYDLKSLPRIIGKYDSNRIKIYSENKKKSFYNIYKVELIKKLEFVNHSFDIIFLENKYALKIIKGLPFNSLYIAISLRNPIYYPFLFIGIIRRIIIGKYRFNQIKILKINKGFTFWLFLKRNNPIRGYEFYLSKDVGIKKFLNFLYINNINYIVPRFFETLPNLKSSTSDLDLIVSDKDVKDVRKFLISNPGDIRVDVWSTSSQDNKGILYLKKEILEGVLNRKKIGPCKSMIPCTKDYLNLLIYHSLYHKGYSSGIKSEFKNNEIYKTNKYSKSIEELANSINIKVGSTMEDMHLYMKKEGWAPSNIQIVKLSKNNYWIKNLIRKSRIIKNRGDNFN